MLSAQQANDPQIQRSLDRRQPGLEFPQTRAEEFRSLPRRVRIRELGHQYEQQFRVLWRGDAVYCLQVREIRITRRGEVSITAATSRRYKRQNAQQCADP